MNGQIQRQTLVTELLEELRPEAIVETGTYRGTTARWLALVGNAPVYTVESESRYYLYSRIRHARTRTNVSLGDSRTFLRKLANDPLFPKAKVFFYLDAHWYSDVPLVDEFQLIRGNWRQFVMLIDDFQVPDDPDYRFDEGFTLENLTPPSDVNVFWPTVRAKDETGWRRGCVVLSDLELRGSMLRRGGATWE